MALLLMVLSQEHLLMIRTRNGFLQLFQQHVMKMLLCQLLPRSPFLAARSLTTCHLLLIQARHYPERSDIVVVYFCRSWSVVKKQESCIPQIRRGHNPNGHWSWFTGETGIQAQALYCIRGS